MRVLMSTGFVCGLLAGSILLLSSCESTSRPSGGDLPVYYDITPSYRKGRLSHLQERIQAYQRDYKLDRLYVQDGSNAALTLLMEKGYLKPNDIFVAPGNAVVRPSVEDEIKYSYLNPEPGTQVSPTTIILAEKDFYYGDKSLYAITDCGIEVFFYELDMPPSEILGKDILPAMIKHQPEVKFLRVDSFGE